MRRAAERREREKKAGKLRAQVPELSQFHLEIEEGRPEPPRMMARHIRRIVVEHAPALFDLPCIERGCQDGGHDLTSDVIANLREHRSRFEGEHVCPGHLNGKDCGRVMHYVGVASYAELDELGAA